MSAALTAAAFHALAAVCAPGVAPETLAAISRTESGLHVLAIGVNGQGGGTLLPATRDEAVAETRSLLRAGRSVDLGLMQINSRNLGWLGLTVEDAFDPCRNLAAGARLLTSLSAYNTGHPGRGIANGYVARVLAAGASNAERRLPALAVPPPSDPLPPHKFTLALGGTVQGRTLTYGR
ncbi:lytic transglycosylase domain-containing protein [Paracraurococcus lichenis]|uniref:Lytic transglycosylase domain-containing protein n=1 Tax=Paracraurococcus lichenis TaxID=3064888 RepID=A0ABT9E6V5_9PROT|nr:lytic transglycosylase domain-containing protein [Paracraurococcus sp. LOR1-02]MDO9711785.1 lytic transglycosylase domain-containing protein [Paracraurococcus sp. LOR1-02]